MAKYFRQITLSLLAVMLSILSIGCGSRVRGGSLLEASGKSAADWADQYNRTDPPSLTVYIETGSYAEEPHQILLPLPIPFVSPMQMERSRTLFFLRITA